MALSDRAKQLQRPVHGYDCSVARALENLPADDLRVFVDLLGTPERRGEPASVIYTLMQDERRDILARIPNAVCAEDVDRLRDLADAYDVKLQTINKHRGGKCRCES